MDQRIYNLDNSASGCWYVIHFLAANGERKALKTLLKNFEKRFMCPKCRMHIKKHLEENPIPPDTIDPWNLFLWTTHFHNEVNIRLKKPIFSEIGEIELFKQLTTGADRDGEDFKLKLLSHNNNGGNVDEIDCEGCTSSSSKHILPVKDDDDDDLVDKKERNYRKKTENENLLSALSKQEWPFSTIRFI